MGFSLHYLIVYVVKANIFGSYGFNTQEIQYGGPLTAKLRKRKHTVSSSFSIPVGICGTDRLIVAKSGRSGTSSALKICIGLVASSARARNDTLLIVLTSNMLMSNPRRAFLFWRQNKIILHLEAYFTILNHKIHWFKPYYKNHYLIWVSISPNQRNTFRKFQKIHHGRHFGPSVQIPCSLVGYARATWFLWKTQPRVCLWKTYNNFCNRSIDRKYGIYDELILASWFFFSHWIIFFYHPVIWLYYCLLISIESFETTNKHQFMYIILTSSISRKIYVWRARVHVKTRGHVNSFSLQ